MDRVTLRVENNSTYIEGRMPSPVYQGLKRALGFILEDFFWVKKDKIEKYELEIATAGGDPTLSYNQVIEVPAYRARYSKLLNLYRQKEITSDWDGCISTICYSGKCKCFVQKKGTHFPTGLLNRALSFFQEQNILFKLIDNRIKPNGKNINLKMSDDFEARDYQSNAVKTILDRGRGIIKCATGAGKTAIGANLITNLGCSPTVFYVTSRDLMRQAKSEIEKFVRTENDEPIEVGVVGDGKCDIRDINVMTVQTAITAVGAKYEKFDSEETERLTKDEKKVIDEKREQINNLIRNAKVIICDECQHWASTTAQVLSDYSISAFHRIGMSATPYRDKGDDIVIEGAFGRVAVDISASLLIDRGVLVPPRIRFFKSPKVNVSKHSFKAIYKEFIVNNMKRNEFIKDLAIKLYDSGGRVLILCQMIDHGKILEEMIPHSQFLNGRWSSKKRAKLLSDIRGGDPSITISTSVFDEGIDVRPLNCLILAGAGSSSTRALQRIGRVIRTFTYDHGEPKKEAFVADFIDAPKTLNAQSKKRLKIYKTEPNFDIKIFGDVNLS